MSKNNPEFSPADLMKMMRQPETQALIARLRTMDASTLEQAARKASAGDTASAKALLEPLLHDGEVQELTRKLRDRHGGI